MGEPVGVESSGISFPDVNGHDSLVDTTTYHPYPASRPFLNTDYQRPPERPVMSFPESNRDGVLSALRNLQEKMQKLEFERQEAENNLQTLTCETELYKTSLHTPLQHHNHHHHHHPSYEQDNLRPARREEEPSSDVESGLGGPGNARSQPRELESQLSSAETRCQLLEKQLEYMRKMVQTAEHDRTQAVQKAEVMQQHHTAPHSPTPDYHTQLNRIGELERDHLRLTATQTLAESKIKELENKLKEERDHRRMLNERALDLESAAVSHQILLNTAPLPEKHAAAPKPSKKPPTSKKKKKKVVSKKHIPIKSEPTKHYRLNLAEIPFVAGQSTAPSHAVGANVQKVLAMMKSHNLALCSSLYNGHSHGGDGGGRSNSPSLSSSSSVSLDQDLADLLAQLQDEFGQLSFEHQEYMRQIHEAKDSRIQEDLERELDTLVLKMEAKGQQISKVRQHQQKLEDAKRQAKRASKKTEPPFKRPNSAMGRLQSNHKQPHSHAHTHTHTKASGNVRPGSSPRCQRESKHQEQSNPSLPNPSLHLLKDMRKLQSTLRRDDLCWE